MRIGVVFICCVRSAEIKHDISKKKTCTLTLACISLPHTFFYIIYHVFLFDLIMWGFIPKIVLDQDGSIVFLKPFVRCVIILCFRRCDMLCVFCLFGRCV